VGGVRGIWGGGSGNISFASPSAGGLTAAYTFIIVNIYLAQSERRARGGADAGGELSVMRIRVCNLWCERYQGGGQVSNRDP